MLVEGVVHDKDGCQCEYFDATFFLLLDISYVHFSLRGFPLLPSRKTEVFRAPIIPLNLYSRSQRTLDEVFGHTLSHGPVLVRILLSALVAIVCPTQHDS
jgi:hypothetical protein